MPSAIRRVAPLIGSVALVATLATTGAPDASAAPPFTPETLTVAGNSIQGVDTSQPLQAGTLYRAVAWGTFDYGVNTDQQIADAECTTDTSNFNPLRNLEPPLPGWVRHRFAFYGTAPNPTNLNQLLGYAAGYNLVNTDFRDPDPNDDAPDLYIDNRNVEWAPVGVSPDSAPNPLLCHQGDPSQSPHVYEAYFTPTRTGPVNFRVFDVHYFDNGAPGPNGENTLTVFVSEIAGSGVSPGRHLETVLVSAQDAGAQSSPLASGRRFLLVAHGMWNYRSLYDLADAECTRAEWDPTYVRDRFGDDTGEIWINGAGVDWVPFVPAQVWVRTRPSAVPFTAASVGCDAVGHFYRTELVGTGGPVNFQIALPPNANSGATGHLSVDIYEIDPGF